jgi:hypothetical protein
MYETHKGVIFKDLQIVIAGLYIIQNASKILKFLVYLTEIQRINNKKGEYFCKKKSFRFFGFN